MNNKKSIFRVGAIKFCTLLIFIIIGYFKIFFDTNVSSLIELGLEQVNRAQVDIKGLRSSLINPSIQIDSIEVTNAKKPNENLIEFKNIKIELLGDALLRAKLVISDVTIQEVDLETRRKTPGEVYPDKDSTLSDEVKNFAKNEIKKLESKNDKNSFGVIAGLISGDSIKDQSKDK